MRGQPGDLRGRVVAVVHLEPDEAGIGHRLDRRVGHHPTALLGPRVYDDVGVSTAGQLSAMPSMHVAWATAIGLTIFLVARSRWRWIGPAHVAGTVFAVTVTGYHWLADGIVGGGVVVVLAVALAWWERRRRTRPGPAA